MPEDAATPQRFDLSTFDAVTRDCRDGSLVASVPGVS
jgi:hypothetical protein